MRQATSSHALAPLTVLTVLTMLTALVACFLVRGPLPAQAQQPPVPTPAPVVRELTLGTTVQGRPVQVVEYGNGPRKLVVVGNTHGGPEANTYHLAQQLVEHFRANPSDVPPDVRLAIIPTINPDGLALNSRYNAAGVDLNRNMNTTLDACPENDWQHTVYGAGGVLSDTGGPYADSEHESRLLQTYLLDASGALFLHSNAGVVFPASCEHPPSNALASLYAQAAGYTYTRFWQPYTIYGSMADWAGSLGIAAATPELVTATSSEFEQNLAGVRAVMTHSTETLPLPENHLVDGVVVPALIWRYWRMHGGEAVFGLPLQAAQPTPDGVTQMFTNVVLEVRQSQAGTPAFVQPTPVVSAAYVRRTAPATCGATPDQCQLFGAFLDFWQRHGGGAVFGSPLTPEFTAVTFDGQQRTVQYFERAVFAYYPEDGSVRLEPLPLQLLLIAQVRAPWVSPQIR